MRTIPVHRDGVNFDTRQEMTGIDVDLEDAMHGVQVLESIVYSEVLPPNVVSLASLLRRWCATAGIGRQASEPWGVQKRVASPVAEAHVSTGSCGCFFLQRISLSLTLVQGRIVV